MQENTIKNFSPKNFNFKKYWRNIDKQILAGFVLLFILGIFFFTVGKRIGCANIPFLNKYFPNSSAVFSFPIIIGII